MDVRIFCEIIRFLILISEHIDISISRSFSFPRNLLEGLNSHFLAPCLAPSLKTLAQLPSLRMNLISTAQATKFNLSPSNVITPPSLESSLFLSTSKFLFSLYYPFFFISTNNIMKNIGITLWLCIPPSPNLFKFQPLTDIPTAYAMLVVVFSFVYARTFSPLVFGFDFDRVYIIFFLSLWLLKQEKIILLKWKNKHTKQAPYK